MTVWFSQTAGTARPAEVLEVLGLPDPNEVGWTVQRTTIELADEVPETRLNRRPQGLDQLKGHRPKSKRKSKKPKNQQNSESLLPGPLSFDS